MKAVPFLNHGIITFSDSTNTGESTGDETQIMSHPNPTLELRSNEEPSPTLEELITSFPPPVFGGRPSAFRSVNVSTNSTGME